MKSAQCIGDTSVSISQTIARIDTQEISFIVPIQEFLTTFGCTVIVNGQHADHPEYHIAIGDIDFVKQIFKDHVHTDTKRLGIVWSQDPLSSVSTPCDNSEKFAFISEKPLSSRLVTDIFQFFFTDATRVRDFRAADEKINTRPPDPQQRFADDRDRISHLVQDLFVSKVNKKHRVFVPVFTNILARLFFICPLFLLPMFLYVGIITATVFTNVQVFTYLSSGKTKEAVSWYTMASKMTVAAEKIHTIYAQPFYWFGAYSIIRPYEQGIDILKKISTIEESALRIVQTTQPLGKSIVSPQEMMPNTQGVATSLSFLQNELRFLVGQLGHVQAGLFELGREHHIPFVWLRKEIVKIGERVAHGREQVNSLSGLIRLFGSLGGFDSKQTYLLLFQNSMELRPTGGFIGSIGTVSFSQGQLLDLSVQDVYTIDGQLKGHVDPPEPMSALLGSEHWYLRDSNWDPDFRKSASRAAWFYEKETGSSVDGVIGISVPILVEFLRATGPIMLVDFNDTITAENFYTKSLYYTQGNFFPGSTQKKDFLGSLARAILLKIQSVDNVQEIMKAILMGLKNRTLMMYSGDIDAQEMIKQYGWSGRVPERAPCRSTYLSTCMGSFLSIVEANLGVNKSNYALKRRITDHITLDQEENVHETIFAEYTNRDTVPYLSYVRFLVLPGSIVEQLQIDGVDVVQRIDTGGPSVPPYIDKVEELKEYMVVPVAISVPPGATSQISVSLVRNGTTTEKTKSVMFQYVVQKQPGTSDDPLRVSIVYPMQWKLEPGDFIAKEGRVEYNTVLSTDRTATFLFSR